MNATLVVRGIMDHSVEILAAGKKIKNGQNLLAVLISSATFRGAQVNDLDVWDEFHKAWPDARLADAS
jgi:L-amino acid N-acyltransferase YncA